MFAAGRWPLAAILCCYAAGAVVCTFPLVLHVSDSLVAAPDPLLNSWILAWDIHSLSTNPLHLYDANIFFPFPLPLTYSETNLTGALTVAPIQWLTANPVLAHNMLTLASVFLCAVGMYLLVRELNEDLPAAALAGFLFAFAPPRGTQLDHVQLLQMSWLPLALVYLHKSLRHGHSRDYLLFAAFTICQVLASFYLMYLTAVVVCAFLVFELFTSWTMLRLRHVTRLAGSLAIVAAVTVPVALPYQLTQQTFNFHWPVELIRDLSAVPLDYLSASPRNMVYGELLAQFQNATFPAEHELFPGAVILVLAAASLLSPHRREVARYMLIAVIAFVLSLGPSLGFSDEPPAELAPYLLLYRFVPGFASMRVPARFDFILMLALAVLAGLGLHGLNLALSRLHRDSLRRAIFATLGVLSFAEVVHRPIGIWPVEVGASVPSAYAWLRAQPPDSVMAEIPADRISNYRYMYMSTYHWHPLVNGDSGFVPPKYQDVSAQLGAFPDPVAVENLRALGVRYVIAHLDALDSVAAHRLAQMNAHELKLQIAATFGSDVVYELESLSAARVLSDAIRLELPSEVTRSMPAAVAVDISNPSEEPLALVVPMRAELEWVGMRSHSEGLTSIPAFLPPGSRTIRVVPIDVPADAGDSSQLRARLSGLVSLDQTQPVRVVNLPTSVQRTGLSASVEGVTPHGPVRAGTRFSLDVFVQNTGHDVWLAHSKDGYGVVGIAARRWRHAGQADFGPDGPSLATDHLTWNVNPGQSAEFELVVPAPSAPGQYELELDMLSESVTWFDDVNGGARTVLPVQVGP